MRRALQGHGSTRSPGLCVLAALALVGLGGCGRTFFFSAPPPRCVFASDCDAGLSCVNQRCVVVETWDAAQPWYGLQFGEACDGGAACASGACVEGPRGAFCTQPCDAGCPATHACRAVPGLGAVCAVPEPRLCQACARDGDCGASGAERCVLLDDGPACARDCSFAPCPEGYRCDGLDGGAFQCVPRGGTCACTPGTVGLQVACHHDGDAGRCEGARRCGADGGYGACSAGEPAFESCNGRDDDCDGEVDEPSLASCTRSSPFGVCAGALACGDAGLECRAALAGPERCNFADDDCDGLVDEDFTDDAGAYLAAAHCGGCGNDCLALLAHATGAECLRAPGAPRCRATACAPGFAPSDAGSCAPLSDGLCRQCVVDADCPGLGSACLQLGVERVCGRPCGAATPYGACPPGFSCAPQGSGAQCVPASGTCLCTAATLGTTLGCRVASCRGYQVCRRDGGAPAWSDCDVASFNREICDTVDDDCDGLVDEGFRDPVTGRYESASSCGFCNNDCTRIWSPTLQHVSGVCDVAAAFPRCTLGPCAREVQGGVTFEWVDTNRVAADGCECRRVLGNVGVDEPDRLPGATAAGSYVDENCDGIDGVAAEALFVAAGAAPLGDGSRARPFQRLGEALAALPGSGRRVVLVAQGTYLESVVLGPGAQLFGGYSSDFGARNPLVYVSLVVGQAPVSGTSGPLAAVHAENLPSSTVETVVSGFTLRGFDAPADTVDDADGVASLAVYLRGVGSGVVLTNNDLAGGRGGPGGRGSTGAQGVGRQTTTALDGVAGLNAGRSTGVCPAGFRRDGGLGGVNPACDMAAPPGGASVCPYVDFDAGAGTGVPNEQEYVEPDGGGNGEGGFDWSFHPLGGAGCQRASTHTTEHDGRDGRAGADGPGGTGGAGAPAEARHGSVVNGVWVAAPGRAAAGSPGAAGAPGGGGGAGGGTVRAPGAACPAWEWGASGGGGGASGCGGRGGRPGGAGGASIAVFVAGTPRLVGNRIARGLGGSGGPGGFGGAGGLGGRGGRGGLSTTWSSSIGGQGGEGGPGGLGGGGGGGAGGPSFGLLAFDVDVAAWRAQNVFVTAPASNTGGAGGPGGSAAGPSATGTDGVAGAFGDALRLSSCAGGCAPGTVCDANGVCVPL